MLRAHSQLGWWQQVERSARLPHRSCSSGTLVIKVRCFTAGGVQGEGLQLILPSTAAPWRCLSLLPPASVSLCAYIDLRNKLASVGVQQGDFDTLIMACRHRLFKLVALECHFVFTSGNTAAIGLAGVPLGLL